MSRLFKKAQLHPFFNAPNASILILNLPKSPVASNLNPVFSSMMCKLLLILSLFLVKEPNKTYFIKYVVRSGICDWKFLHFKIPPTQYSSDALCCNVFVLGPDR